VVIDLFLSDLGNYYLGSLPLCPLAPG